MVDCADGDGNDDSVIFNSIMSSHLSCKIRFEAPMRQPWREVKRNDAACKVNFNYKLLNIEKRNLLLKLYLL